MSIVTPESMLARIIALEKAISPCAHTIVRPGTNEKPEGHRFPCNYIVAAGKVACPESDCPHRKGASS